MGLLEKPHGRIIEIAECLHISRGDGRIVDHDLAIHVSVWRPFSRDVYVEGWRISLDPSHPINSIDLGECWIERAVLVPNVQISLEVKREDLAGLPKLIGFGSDGWLRAMVHVDSLSTIKKFVIEASVRGKWKRVCSATNQHKAHALKYR